MDTISPGMWAVHSLHAPPVQVLAVDEDGFTHSKVPPGPPYLRSGLSDPLSFHATEALAREWQEQRKA